MAADPYKYFRIEGRELEEGLTRGVLALERGEATTETVARLLRLAHTLKGAARVVKLPEIARAAHAIEEILEPHRQGQETVSPSDVAALLRAIDEIGARVGALQPDAPSPAPLRPPSDAPPEVGRIEADDMSVLLDGVVEATVLLSALARETAALERAQQLAGLLVEQLAPRRLTDGVLSPVNLQRSSSLAGDLLDTLVRGARALEARTALLGRELSEVQGAANRLRLLPAGSIFSSLERAARDAARFLQKTISFQGTGGEGRLDAQVLGALRDALSHVVRNSVAHGIEPEHERLAAGKPGAGRISIEVLVRGDRVAFLCKDDGRGVDLDAVRRAAVRGGRLDIATASAASPRKLHELLLEGGLSTSQTVTEVSGRGIGLDVVRDTIAKLGGQITIHSEPRVGTTFEIEVPISLSALSALVVDAAGSDVVIPLSSVVRTLRLPLSDVTGGPDGDSILFEENVIPFAPLADVLGLRGARRGRTHWPLVVLSSAGMLAALGVDRLRGTETVVVRSIPSYADLLPTIAGASFDAEGHARAVVDPRGVVAAARSRRPRDVGPAPAPRHPILVIDDSLTTRMLERSILESAGYEVEVATSAEEGLAKAKERVYGLFVVDVEMPGMDGFEFVTQTRSDPALREIPSILVTSRSAPEDLRKGRDVGARAYIVKGEFDQENLLRSIRQLLG